MVGVVEISIPIVEEEWVATIIVECYMVPLGKNFHPPLEFCRNLERRSYIYHELDVVLLAGLDNLLKTLDLDFIGLKIGKIDDCRVGKVSVLRHIAIAIMNRQSTGFCHPNGSGIQAVQVAVELCL